MGSADDGIRGIEEDLNTDRYEDELTVFPGCKTIYIIEYMGISLGGLLPEAGCLFRPGSRFRFQVRSFTARHRKKHKVPQSNNSARLLEASASAVDEGSPNPT